MRLRRCIAGVFLLALLGGCIGPDNSYTGRYADKDAPVRDIVEGFAVSGHGARVDYFRVGETWKVNVPLGEDTVQYQFREIRCLTYS